MRAMRSRIVWGILLVAMGVLFLLESLTLLEIGSAWAILFAAGGLAFLYTFLANRESWWAIIPALALLGIAILIGIGVYFPGASQVGAAIFMGLLALSFWIIALVTRMEQWWAFIPGGVLLSLAVALGLEPLIGGEAFVGIFFLGMGLTFGVLYLVPVTETRMRWALIPAGVLGAMGLIFLAAASTVGYLIWPIALIVVGGFLLLRAVAR